MKILVITLIYLSFNIHAQTFRGTHNYEAKVYYSGLKRPWAIEVGPENDLFITQKGGSLLVIREGKVLQNITGIPKSLEVIGQGGLLDITFHPNFSGNQFVYLSYTTRENARPRNGINTRISRFKLINGKLSEEKILIQGGFGNDGAHFGCRLVFGLDKKLYATFGERHNKDKAQDPAFLNGKVIRINDDGSIPQDNPFVGIDGAREEIFTLGHRNPQGIDIHPIYGTPVISEHGPSGYDATLPGLGGVGKADEVNWLLSGRNYGWPTIFGTPEILPWTQEMLDFVKEKRVVMPIKEFTIPDGIAPSGASFYQGDKFPKWKNDFFVTALRGYIIRLKIDSEGKLLEEEKILPTGFGRLRDITTGEDGNLYVISDQGMIVQIMPSKGGGVEPGHTVPDPDLEQPEKMTMEKIVKKHNCTTCHFEFNPLDNIPAIWIGKTSTSSPLYLAVKSGKMPLGGEALNDRELEIVKRWIDEFLNTSILSEFKTY